LFKYITKEAINLTDLLSSVMGTLILLGTASFMIVITLLMSTSEFMRQKRATPRAMIGIVLGMLAIYGTAMGTKLADGTIINVRELAAMIAGLTGGPIAGLLAGIIGGVHRYTLGGTTALPCTISTVLIGIIAGLVALYSSRKLNLAKVAVLGLVLESGAMGAILLLVQPLDAAVNIVSQIAFPMITANTIGLVLWAYLFNKLDSGRAVRSQSKTDGA